MNTENKKELLKVAEFIITTLNVKGYNPYRDRHGRFAKGPRKMYERKTLPNKKEQLDEVIKRLELSENKRVSIEVKKSAFQKIKDMRRYNVEFAKNFEGFKKKLGLKGSVGPMKKVNRVARKAEAKYGGNVHRVKDIVRGTIVVSSPKQLDQVLKVIKEKNEVGRVKDNMNSNKDGEYKDAKITIKFGNGHFGEIIVATPEFLQAKSAGGHDYYRVWRSTTASLALKHKAEQSMRQLYTKAQQDQDKRLKLKNGIDFLVDFLYNKKVKRKQQ